MTMQRRKFLRLTAVGAAGAGLTLLDWARWTMYGDTAARDRLAADASGTKTKWEAQLG
ncbi:twin-arginine translocation signal domain-containing protein [Amycolatopsis sp. NPDC058278]|uniref:twin-arginine translocation signal domain-containing protein n=1 Tax=Amycolatopsis sp. NPDC058278 TaxID=3346417 RepID=UPI0036DB1E96